ncbi:MAG: hypothetical protein VYA39_04865 [Candidatus Thermoplasmatota archaeon]|nr:hypothetical protein [Candidatus Thermoplasmatota archaeon]
MSYKGPHNREKRFEMAAKAICASIVRNMPLDQGGCGVPVLVEGIKDERALRDLGFKGVIERINKGWDTSRLVAYLHSEYGDARAMDGGAPIILLMDWDRTGGKLQSLIRERLMAMDVTVDEGLRNSLLKAMKPEGRTVESLSPYSEALAPMIDSFLDDIL